jgi:hypothetical protein
MGITMALLSSVTFEFGESGSFDKLENACIEEDFCSSFPTVWHRFAKRETTPSNNKSFNFASIAFSHFGTSIGFPTEAAFHYSQYKAIET